VRCVSAVEAEEEEEEEEEEEKKVEEVQEEEEEEEEEQEEEGEEEEEEGERSRNIRRRMRHMSTLTLRANHQGARVFLTICDMRFAARMATGVSLLYRFMPFCPRVLECVNSLIFRIPGRALVPMDAKLETEVGLDNGLSFVVLG